MPNGHQRPCGLKFTWVIRSPVKQEVHVREGSCVRCSARTQRMERDAEGMYFLCVACRDRLVRRAQWRRHYAVPTNRARIRAYQNTDEYRARASGQQAQWRARNPGRARALRDVYDMRKRTNGPVEKVDRRAVWGRDEGHCRIKLVCDGAFVPFEEMHLDHVIPISKGGTHTWNNVQTGCAPCNLTKSASVPV